ncbi:MAG: hypothetical protein JO112_11665 [Planctomycetes bacterium]|nr:hypothetical protein [Planctomycetota bacterium]
MVASNLPTSPVRKHPFVPVSWRKADSLRSHLQRHGIHAIACFDPANRTAVLEIVSEVSPETLEGILNTAP